MREVKIEMNKPSKISRTIELERQGEKVRVVGLVKGERQGEYELEIIVQHKRGGNRGKIVIRAVASGGAVVRLRGKIKIDKGANKVENFMDLRALILDDRSRAYVDPQLEIEADEVRAGHGVSVSKVDDEQVKYLMARGLSRKQAKEMLVEGFFSLGQD